METKTGTLQHLSGHNYMCLTTFRKSGEAMPTPVWFALVEGKVYMMTKPNVGKVKRIRNNAQVEVAPCDMRGKLLGGSVEAMARILPDDQAEPAKQALNKKYGLMKRIFDLMGRLRGDHEIYLEITAM